MATYVNLSEWQIDQVIRCANDPWYCLMNFVWLEREADLDNPIVPFDPFEKQELIIRALLNREKILCNKSRRVGWSWSVAFVCWYLINFHPGVKILLLSRTEDDAVLILDKVKFIHKNLAFRDSGIIDSFEDAEKAPWLAGEVGADNNSTFSRIFRDDYGNIESISTVVSLTNTDNSGRGRGATFIMLDEFAFYENADIVWRSISKTIIGGGWWAVGSTPNSVGNKFHWLVTQAEHNRNVAYKYLTFHWRESWVPEKEVEADKAESTDQDANQEWELEFIAHGNTAFDPAKLALCYKPPEDFPEVEAELERYRQMVEARQAKYFSGADTIKGKIHRKSTEKDYNAFGAFTQTRIQAYAYSDQSNIGDWAGHNYETGGNKYWVRGTLSKLHEEFPGLLAIEEEGPGETALANHDVPKDGISEVIAYGVTGTKKHDAVRHVMTLIDNRQITITDKETYDQMMMFQDNGPGKNRFSAPPGYNDDRVTIVLAAMQAVEEEGGRNFNWSYAAKDFRESYSGQIGVEDVKKKLERTNHRGPMLDVFSPYPGSERLTDAVEGPGQIDMAGTEFDPAKIDSKRLSELMDEHMP